MPEAIPQQAEQAPQSDGPEQMITQAHAGMAGLMDMMEKVPNTDPQDKQRLATIIQQFEAFIEDMGKPAGQQPPAPAAPGGPAPMMAGAGQARPAM